MTSKKKSKTEAKNTLRKLIKEIVTPYAGTLGSYPSPSGPLHHRGGVRSQSSSELDKTEPDKLPTAACVLIRRASDGMFLAVSRRDDPDAFGLPGGKIDPGETPAQAAMRELREETGLSLSAPRLLFEQDDGEGYVCYTFSGKVSGDFKTSEQGVIKWVNKQTLLDGPFGNYNQKLFDHLGL